jgi:hypothetical protein
VTRWRVFVARVGELIRGRRLERELDEEVRLHLDLLTDQFVRQGFGRDDARVLARREFGGVLHAKELVRDRRGFSIMDAFIQDVRYAVRLLLKSRASPSWW